MKTRIYEVSNLNNIIKVLKKIISLYMVSIMMVRSQLMIKFNKNKMFLFLDLKGMD